MQLPTLLNVKEEILEIVKANIRTLVYNDEETLSGWAVMLEGASEKVLVWLRANLQNWGFVIWLAGQWGQAGTEISPDRDSLSLVVA